MSSRFKLALSLLCAVALMLMPVSSAWGDPSSGDMIASGQIVVPADQGNRIDSFVLDEDRNFQSLGSDSGKPTLTLSTSKLQEIVKNKLLPQWSGVAASVFRNQSSQLIDLYGEQPVGGNMSWDGFDSYFNMDRGNTKYKDEKWSCYNLRNSLAQTYPTHEGDAGWDQFIVTGVRQVNSLGQARTLMAQSLRDSEKTDAVTTQEFLDADEAGETRLDALDSDEQTNGFANVVTAINCKGGSADFDYVSFGILFYDFEAVPVAAKGLEYQTGRVWDDTVEKPGYTSETTNGQQQEILHSALLGDSVTETTSTTLSALASYKMSESIGANIGWSETESSEDTEFWADDESMGASTSGWSETTSMGLNWGTAWEMAGALGAEVGHSTSKEISKAVESTVLLPAHTAATIVHGGTTTTYTQNYQQPTILNYKVALYAMSGDFYSSSAFGGIGAINPSQYDKQSLVILFDTKGETDTSYGCDATDDLYSRIVTNSDVQNYDVAEGRTYSTHSTASGWTKSEDIQWNLVKDTAQTYYGVKIDDVARTNYFYETLGKLNVDKDKTTSAVQSIYPLYDLASVRTAKTNYVLYSNNTLDTEALALDGYNRFNVPFYGFNPAWGQWYRCDENGVVIGDGALLEDDPAELSPEGVLIPKAGTTGGTVYMTWKLGAAPAPKTYERPEGQDLDNSDIETPVVTIDVINVGLDNPHVTAEGTYTGFYGNPINLNDVITYEITDGDDKILEIQPRWESREPVSAGIRVTDGTGDVTFTKPGTYKVRPYIVNNDNKKVYSPWLTVVATEHNFVHYDAKEATCELSGWAEHYRCTDCDKYYSDAVDTAEIPAEEVIIPATGHDWGEWTTTKEATAEEPGEQQRVCKNDATHAETRGLYMVSFHTNGRGGAPEPQSIPAGQSATVPQEPTTTGYTFEGWFTDPECTTPYNFGATVQENLTLYADWQIVTRTVAAMAIGEATENEEGEIKIDPVARGTITIEGEEGEVIPVTEGDYTYYYKNVEYGTPVTVTVTPDEGFGLKDIVAIPVNPDGSMGEPFTPNKTGANTYSFTMPDADVAVLADFSQVTVTYDGNAPEGKEATNVPEAEKIPYGGTATKLGTEPAIEATLEVTYEFGGWFTDKDCTKPFLSATTLTEDTTLYAKWIETEVPLPTVSYTLSWEPEDAEDPGEYEDSYKAEPGSTAYDPTEDLYDLAGKDLRAAYVLYTQDGASWFTDPELTMPFIFETPITEDIHLYAKVVPREYDVTYFNGSVELGKQSIAYNTAIGTIASTITTPEREGYVFADEWVTDDGAPWNIAKNPVTSDLKLFASYRVPSYGVKFDSNGGSGRKADASVEAGTGYTLPAATTFTAPKGMCGFEAWEVQIGSGEPETKQPGDEITVTGNTTVKALWLEHDWSEWTQTTAPTCVAAGEEERVCSRDDSHKETREVDIDPDAHEWSEWELTKKATIGAEGEESRVCAHDETHIDTRPVSKVDPTPLNDAIKAAQDDEPTAVESADGSDVKPSDDWVTADDKKALKDAIDAAQKVADDPDATQDDVDTATADMKKATEAYDKAKQAGKKTVVLVVTDKIDISKATIAKVADKVYTGKAFKPTPEVTLGDKTLENGTDYTLSYAANKKVGTATITATGKGTYKGSVRTTFNIVPAKTKVITVGHYKARTLEVNFNKVKGATDYVVAYRKVGATKWTEKSTGGKTTYNIKGLKSRGLYEVKVAAKGGGVQGAWSNVCKRYFYRVANFKVTPGKGIATAAWTVDKKAVRYQVRYATSEDMTKGLKTIAVPNAKAAKQVIKKLKKGKTYWVQVRPYTKYQGKTYVGVLTKKKVTVK